MLTVTLAAAATPVRAQADDRDAPGAGQSLTTIPAVENAPDTDDAGNFARTIGGDFRRFFARENVHVGVLFGAAALASARWDRSVANGLGPQPPGIFSGGNAAGTMWVQTGGALATMAAGSLLHRPEATALGSELLRAQLLLQALVQTAKLSARRSRPDASNRRSLPSGHTASAFATASVLERRFGWKAGVPAYAFGGYVAASRIASHKHYLSDVLVGAAVGVAAGRAATVGVGRARFNVGVTFTNGGAAVTFARQP